MIDYAAVVDTLQRTLGVRFKNQPEILNVPGKSLVCKIDPFYYLGLYPDLCETLSLWAKMPPSKIMESLVRTGNLVRGSGPGSLSLKLGLVWVDRGLKRAELDVCFVHSSFVDRAVKLYGKAETPRVSALKIAAVHEEEVQGFLDGKTEVQKTAFF